MDDIYNLKLHDALEMKDHNAEIMRVAGGWIYTNYSQIGASSFNVSSVFVPFNNEFMGKEPSNAK
jgi:hypothetical protein